MTTNPTPPRGRPPTAPEAAPRPSRYLRIEEVAQRLGIGRSTAYRHIQAGRIPSIRIGGSVRVPERALDAWEAAATRQPTLR